MPWRPRWPVGSRCTLCGLTNLACPPLVQGGRLGTFAQRLQHWVALTYVLHNLNRSLGLPDGYPFLLAPPVLAKLRFVHDMIAAESQGVGEAC